MKISEEKKGDFLVVSVEGEINIDTSPQLRESFTRSIKKGLNKIVVDCIGLLYVDSSGLATLIELLQRLKKTDGELRICNLSDKVKGVFEVTKLDKLFDIYSSKKEALGEA